MVTKNGAFVGRPFDSREEAKQIAEREKLADPSAVVRVQSYPIFKGGLDPAEGKALVEAILEGEDFSNLPPEHRGPIDSSGEGQGEGALDVASEHDNPEQGEKATLIEGSSVKRTWGNLRPELRLALCAEFLRYHRDSRYPRLAHLLLPVADRDPGRYGFGSYHADIYGLAEDGTEVFPDPPRRRQYEVQRAHAAQGRGASWVRRRG